MEAAEARKVIKPANDLIKALGIKDLQQHFLKHREFFTEQEIKEYYQNFQKFDADRDGKISAADITRIASKMGEKVDKKKIAELMHPKKPTDTITFDDFLDIMKDIHHGTIPSDKGFAQLYFKGKDLIKFPSEFRLKEISPTFHSTTSDELCVLLCFVNMFLKDSLLEQEAIIPLDCLQVSEIQKLCNGRIFCYLLNALQEGLVPKDKMHDKPDLSKVEMAENQALCLFAAEKYGCDIKDIEPVDLVEGVEYRLLAVLSQIHQVAKHKIDNLDKQIEDFFKKKKEVKKAVEEKAKQQPTKGGKPKRTRGERKQRTGMKKEAKEFSHFEEGMDPEEFLTGWCNFHLKKFEIEVFNLSLDFAGGMNFLYLMNCLNDRVMTQDLLNQGKQLSFDQADKKGEMVLDVAKQLGAKLDITPVDIIKGDFLINFAFVNQLYNLFVASSHNIQDIIKFQNECLGYIIKNVNDLEDYELLMEEEIGSLRDNVENLEDSLAGIVGELLVDSIGSLTGMPIDVTIRDRTPAEEVFEQPIMGEVPQAPVLPAFFGLGIEPMEQVMQEVDESMKEAETVEYSIQSQMMDLMRQMQQMISGQQPAKPAIPSTIQSEVEQAISRKTEIQYPEKEGLAYMKGVLKWKPCKLFVKDNRLFVFKAGKEKPSEDIYLSEAIKIAPETLSQGYYGIRLSLSLVDSIILGWTDEFVMKDWYAFLSTKIRPLLTRTEFVMSGQHVVPQSTVQYQRVPVSPAILSTPSASQFLIAVQEGDIPRVRNMFEQGVDPLFTNDWGGNCLHIAAAYGNKDMTKFLTDTLESKELIKFLINQPTNFDKNTPLHLAVKTGDAKLCQMLLDKGASKDLKNSFNETPAELANSRGILDVIAIFAPPAAVPPAPALHQSPFLIRGAPMSAYRPQMTASQSPYILPSSSPYYRYRTQPF